MKNILLATMVCFSSAVWAAPTGKLLGNFAAQAPSPGSVTLHASPTQHEYRVALGKSSPHTKAWLTFDFGRGDGRGARSAISSDVSLHAAFTSVGGQKIASFHVPADFIMVNSDKVYNTRPELRLAINVPGQMTETYQIANAH